MRVYKKLLAGGWFANHILIDDIYDEETINALLEANVIKKLYSSFIIVLSEVILIELT